MKTLNLSSQDFKTALAFTLLALSLLFMASRLNQQIKVKNNSVISLEDIRF